MDSMRGLNAGLPPMEPDLVETFKTAALTVTKLYKTANAAKVKARSDGYQDCLEDLLAFLDKEKIGTDGPGAKLRRWISDRQGIAPAESDDDDADKPEPASSPVNDRSSSDVPISSARPDVPDTSMQTDTMPLPAQDPPASGPASTPAEVVIVSEPAQVAVPTRDTFSFQSGPMYPQGQAENYPNLATLDLSDNNAVVQAQTVPTPPTPTVFRRRVQGNDIRNRGTSRTTHRVAGQKRKLNFNELFDLGNLGQGRDGKDGWFGGGAGTGKRSRHS